MREPIFVDHVMVGTWNGADRGLNPVVDAGDLGTDEGIAVGREDADIFLSRDLVTVAEGVAERTILIPRVEKANIGPNTAQWSLVITRWMGTKTSPCTCGYVCIHVIGKSNINGSASTDEGYFTYMYPRPTDCQAISTCMYYWNLSEKKTLT